MSLPKDLVNCIILDNGAGRIKHGLFDASLPYGIENESNTVASIANCTARIHKQMQVLVGDDIDNIANGSVLQYSRPFDRGYLNNWSMEIEIWHKLFSSPHYKSMKLQETSLIMTEPIFNPEPWQNETNEVVFEYFGFQSYLRKPAAWFSAYHLHSRNPEYAMDSKSCVVVDSGFSFSHIVPFTNLKCAKHAIKRVNIGGKLLTNYLKEIVSYRQWNMMDEFKLMDQVKEELAFVSLNFMRDCKNLRSTTTNKNLDYNGELLRKYFVLPDFQNITKGYVKPDGEPIRQQDEQVLTMESERFAVPELLFHPNDIGMQQAGIVEAAWQSLCLLDEVELGLCSSNFVFTGGNSKFANFQERFVRDLRPFIPSTYDINYHETMNPIDFAWCGAHRFLYDIKKTKSIDDHFITKEQYLEYGNHYCNEKFNNSW